MTSPQAQFQQAVALYKAGELAKARAAFANIVRAHPGHFDSLHLLAWLAVQAGEFEEALAPVSRAIALRPDFAQAYVTRGRALASLGRSGEAISDFDAAIRSQPGYAEAWFRKANALKALKQPELAIDAYSRSLALAPVNAETLYNRGVAFTDLKRFDEAIADFEAAKAINPDHALVLGGLGHAALQACDWTRTDALAPLLIERAGDGRTHIPPFVLLGYPSSAAAQLACARQAVLQAAPHAPEPLWRGERYQHGRIRVAYLSADFRRHPVASQTVEMFELHDRSRFETVGVSLGPDDGSDIRQRLEKAFDRFEDASGLGDKDVARMLRRLEIDIAVDLTGHTQNARTAILAHRPAPVQVSYLGYAGTMGAGFIDYVVADAIVAPMEQQPFFTETIIHLPDTFWVADSTNAISPATPTRSAAGLPETGVVFCCFNNTFKISRSVFDCWARILARTPDSVLWLRGDNAEAIRNLRAEAQGRGIDPARLVFANPAHLLADHLARHRLADLFLDTLPYNAHATASDALWAGLPVLTLIGETFVGRVAASLLTAIGMPELITTTPQAYEDLAVELAHDPARLGELRARLARNRETMPLFNTLRFTRNLEAAYARMLETTFTGMKSPA